jgi:putative membrane protein
MDERTRTRPVTAPGLAANYGRGLLMGAADIVPGVSGGTVALIVGIYERLIRSIRAGASVPVRLVRGDVEGMRARLREVEWGLVIPLGAGILTALLIGASVIEGLLDRYPAQSRGLFFGLIAASIPIPWRRVRARTTRTWVIAGCAAAAAVLLVAIPPQTITDPALPLVFGAAAIAICAMILPGISGSFLLLILGMYVPTLAAVNDRNLLYIAVFAAGAVIGLGVFSKLLEWLLARRHDATMAALVGLMLGSLRALWPWQDLERRVLRPPGDGSELVVIGLLVLGFAAVTLLVRAGARSEERTSVPG